MPRFRILQIAINALVFVLLTSAVVDLAVETRWRFDGRHVPLHAALLISVAGLVALVGSIRLNFQILRNSKFNNVPSRSSLPQFYALAFAIALLCITLERRAITSLMYDSHLSTYYMGIEVPDWLQFSFVDGAFSIQDYKILNLLAYLVGISLFFMTRNISLAIASTNIVCNKVNPSLTKYQIALGITFLLFAVIS